MKTISEPVMDILMKYQWPGNVRELENVLVQGILYADSDTIEPGDIPSLELADTKMANKPARNDKKIFSLSYKQAKEQTLRDFNHLYIGERLAMSDGNITLAAKNSDLDRQALQQLMKRFDIDPQIYR